MGRGIPRHDRDSSPINDQQGVPEDHADPCVFHETLRRSHKHSILFHLSHDTRSSPRLDHRYPHILVHPCLTSLSTCFMTLHTL
jgi:hypothetical protein